MQFSDEISGFGELGADDSGSFLGIAGERHERPSGHCESVCRC